MAHSSVAAILVVASIQAFNHAVEVNQAAERAKQGATFEPILLVASGSILVDQKIAATAKNTISRNALDHQALDKLLLASFQRSDANLSKLQKIVGKVSRRSSNYLTLELLTSAEDQDIQRVVIAFDRMASLAPNFRETLFSIIAPVLEKPEGARLLGQRQSRSWFPRFVTSLAQQPDQLNKVAEFLASIRIKDGATRKMLLEAVVKNYADSNEIVKAQMFASTFGEAKDIDWNNLDFHSSIGGYSDIPLTWRFPNADALAAIDSQGNLKFVVSGGIGQEPLAEKLLLFKPGLHRIQARVELGQTSDDMFLFWKIGCGKLPIRQSSELTTKKGNNQEFVAIVFEADPQCTGYRLSLLLNGQSRQFDRVEIEIGRPNDTN